MENRQAPLRMGLRGVQNGDCQVSFGNCRTFPDPTPGVSGVQGAEAVHVLWRAVEVVEKWRFTASLGAAAESKKYTQKFLRSEL